MKTTYILTKITYSACPAFEVIGSYENYDLARLVELKLLQHISENESVNIKEVVHNDSQDLGVDREGVEVHVSDEYDNRHYLEAMTKVEPVLEGPVEIGKTIVSDGVEVYGTELKKSKLSKQLKRLINNEAERVVDYLNENS